MRRTPEISHPDNLPHVFCVRNIEQDRALGELRLFSNRFFFFFMQYGMQWKRFVLYFFLIFRFRGNTLLPIVNGIMFLSNVEYPYSIFMFMNRVRFYAVHYVTGQNGETLIFKSTDFEIRRYTIRKYQ